MAAEEVGARLVVSGQEQFQQAFDHAQKSIDHLSDSITKAEKPTGTLTAKSMALAVAMGQALYNAAAAAARAIVDFAGSSITAASDLNETISKSQMVFGDWSGALEDFGDSAATSLGMSKNAAMSAAATYGNLFRSMGMATGESADMSIELVQLAGDLASFNNIKPEEALEKLRAGLVGESEPLKSLGININEDLLKAEALGLGLVKSVKKPLDAVTKAQAAYSLIMKQSSLAQGDFARTSTGLANQQRIMAANMENLKATLGTALLPIVNKVMLALNNLFNSEGFKKGLDFVINGFKWVIDQVENLMAVIEDAGVGSSEFFEALSGIFGDWVFTIRDVIEQVVPIFTNIFETVKGIVIGFLNIVQRWWSDNGAAIISVVQGMWEKVKALFSAAIEFIQTLVSFVLTNIQLFWKTHGDKVIAVVNWLWGAIQTVFNTAVGIITAVFNAFTDLLQGNWAAFGQHLLDAWNILWGAIKSAAEGAWAVIGPWFQGIIQSIVDFFTKTDWLAVGGAILNGIWEGLKAGWAWLSGEVNKMAQGLLDSVLSYLRSGGANQNAYTPGGMNMGIVPQTPYSQLPKGVVNPTKYDKGGWFDIPMGFGNEGFNLGGLATASGGERVIILPKSMSAGPTTNNYSNNNNYNLNVMTSQSPALVQRSFAMMKLLAG